MRVCARVVQVNCRGTHSGKICWLAAGIYCIDISEVVDEIESFLSFNCSSDNND